MINLKQYFRKYKEDLLSILTTIGIFVLILIPKPNFLKTPIFLFAIIAYYYFILARSLYVKIKYRRKHINAVRFNTSNDEYYKLSNLIIGSLIILTSITFFILGYMINEALIAAILGLLLALNGYYFIPIGNFQFQENHLLIETQYLRNKRFLIEEIKELTFGNQSIVVTKPDEEKQSFPNLNISPQQLSAISNYLNIQAPQINTTFKYTDI